jgi:hypothetical protein
MRPRGLTANCAARLRAWVSVESAKQVTILGRRACCSSIGSPIHWPVEQHELPERDQTQHCRCWQGSRLQPKPGGLRLFPTLFEITLIGTATPAEYLEKKNDPNNVPPLPAQYLSAAQGGVSPHGGRTHGSRRKNRRLRRVRRQLALPRPGAAAGVAAAGADRQGALIWLAQQASGRRGFRLEFPQLH